jgi:hypothetical protein
MGVLYFLWTMLTFLNAQNNKFEIILSNFQVCIYFLCGFQ